MANAHRPTTNMASKKTKLPKRCFLRGQRIWIRYKNEKGVWVNKKTPYTLTQVPDAARYAAAIERGIKQKKEQGIQDAVTLAEYIERWLVDREEREVASAVDDRGRMEKYVIPYIGKLPLDGVRVADVRDLMRKLKALKDDEGHEKLAPRTRLHVYRTLHTIYESAIVDELVLANPVKVKKEDIPKKLDADREWRALATYTVDEVERLISDERILPQRRVMYALKAIAGLRHGEAAALCWRHRDTRATPLHRLNIVQAWCSRRSRVKSTKTEITRAVPEHPTLTKLLSAWRLLWPTFYGRQPTADDFIVPTLQFTGVNASDANEAFKRDLALLELRIDAGERRDRGGHDLRGFYKTRLIEDGADSLIIQRTTHAEPRDVEAGYQRFSWAVICREVAKLKIDVLDGKVLTLVTSSLQASKNAVARWSKVATPTGFEPANQPVPSRAFDAASSKNADRDEPSRTENVTSVTALNSLEAALVSGDSAAALTLVRSLLADSQEKADRTHSPSSIRDLRNATRAGR